MATNERERKIMQRHQTVDTAVAMMSVFGEQSDESDGDDLSMTHFKQSVHIQTCK